MVPIAECC